MPYGYFFTSLDPIRRRMSLSSSSVSPGFIGVIASIDESTAKVDVWVQGSTYVLRNVPYATSLEKKPDYIRERSVVYLRHSRGNKFVLEVEGPAFIIPTVSAGGAEPIPPIPPEPNAIISGLRLIQSATPAMSIAVTTGTARLGGAIVLFDNVIVGETLTSKLSGASITQMKVGSGAVINNTYIYIPIDTAPTNGEFRYDNIELGEDQVIDYRAGTPAVVPSQLTPQTDHLLMGRILVRPDATAIYNDDINAVFAPLLYFVDVIPFSYTTEVADIDSPIPFLVTVNFTSGLGGPAQGIPVVSSFIRGEGRLDPASQITDGSGYAVFTYTREAGTTKSAEIQFQETIFGAIATARVINNDAGGVPLPYS